MFAVLVFVGIMAFEADYTSLTRSEFFAADDAGVATE
jgi:cytochrome c oxidase subunit IV